MDLFPVLDFDFISYCSVTYWLVRSVKKVENPFPEYFMEDWV